MWTGRQSRGVCNSTSIWLLPAAPENDESIHVVEAGSAPVERGKKEVEFKELLFKDMTINFHMSHSSSYSIEQKLVNGHTQQQEKLENILSSCLRERKGGGHVPN